MRFNKANRSLARGAKAQLLRVGMMAICLLIISACAGNASAAPASSRTTVTISPTTATVQVGGTQQFTAAVSGSRGSTSASWLVNGIQGGNSSVGTISSKGLYKAPARISATIAVTVTAAAGKSNAQATVTVLAPPAPSVSVSVSPASATVASNGTQQFSATINDPSNSGVTWLVNGVAGGAASTGTITSGGLYTAPPVSANTAVTVAARSNADSTKVGSASVTVTAPAPSVAISISPSTATMQSSGTQQFTASVTNTTNTGVTWSVQGGGTISTSGLYTAPSVTSNTSVKVVATSNADTSKQAVANITITAPAPAVAISISPSTATVQSSGTQQFMASVTNTTNTGVTWSVQGGGTISTSGLYAAPSVTSNTTATVIATSNADSSKQAVASVTITAPATSGNTVNVQTYGATGNGVNDDTSPIANAIAALKSGDTLYFPCGTYKTSSQLSLRISNVAVAGPVQSPNCVTIKAVSGGPAVFAISSSSGLGSTTPLTADAADQATSVSANFGGIAVVAGNYIVLSEGGKGFSTDTAPGNSTGCDVSGCRGDVAKVTSVSGSVATLDRPLNHPYVSVNAPTVRKIAAPISGVRVSNINLDCSSTISGGLSLSYAVNSSITDVGGMNCVDSGIKALYGHGNTFTRTAVVNSGSPNAGAVDIRNQNRMTLDTMDISVNGAGHNFGLGVYVVNDSTASNISVKNNNSSGRSFKVHASARNSFTNGSTSGVGGGTSGFAIEYYSHHNTFSGWTVTGNTGHAVSTFGNFNTYNKFINFTVTGNTGGNAFAQTASSLGTVNDHYTTIQGGTWSGASGYAVLQMNSSYLTMTGATVKGPGSSGLCLGGLSGEVVNGTSVSNNMFSGLPAGGDIYLSAGGGTGNHFTSNTTPDGTYPNPLP